MTTGERRALIAQYEAGYQVVTEALAGLTPEELDRRPAPGEWSAREIVHHLADAETTWGVRLRRLLTEEAPFIRAWDQDDYARRLHYRKRPMEPSLRAFEAARATTAQILRGMTEADWQRAGTHSETGPFSATCWLEVCAGHAHGHARQIREARASPSAEPPTAPTPAPARSGPREARLARYRAGYQEVVDALRGIAPDELDFRPSASDWSPREVVQHLADSEVTSGIRLRRLLVESAPILEGYDEHYYAERLRYRARSIEPALRAVEAARATTAEIADLMAEADWQRSGTHTESGPYSAAGWLEIYAAHAHDHAGQIRQARAAWAGTRGRRP